MHTSNMLLRSNGLHEMDAWGGRQMHRTWPESASCSLATVYRGMVRLGVSGGRACASPTCDLWGLPMQVCNATRPESESSRTHLGPAGGPQIPERPTLLRYRAPAAESFVRSCRRHTWTRADELWRRSSLYMFLIRSFPNLRSQHCANRGASTAAKAGQAAPRRRGPGSTAPAPRGLPVGAVLRRRCCRRSGSWCRAPELRCAERPHKRAYILSRSAAGILIQLNPRNRIRVHH